MLMSRLSMDRRPGSEDRARFCSQKSQYSTECSPSTINQQKKGEGAESEAFELCKAPVGGGGGIGGPDWDIARDAGESAWRVPQGLSYFCSRPSAKKTIKRDGGRFKTVLLFLSDPV